MFFLTNFILNAVERVKGVVLLVLLRSLLLSNLSFGQYTSQKGCKIEIVDTH